MTDQASNAAEPAIRQPILGDVSVCYSGGLDSTTVAYLAAQHRKGHVHLHTMRHGYGYLFYWWAARTARSLARALPEGTVSHRYLLTKDLFTDLAIRSLFADGKAYGEWFGCCLGCTMAMVTKILVYNLERTIPHIMFASSVGGQYAVMSTPLTTELLKDFCGAYGVRYSTPLIENRIVKQQERDLLDRVGIFRGLRFLDKHSFHNQGYCLLSLQHGPDVLLNVHPNYTPEKVRRFFTDKRPICERYIARHFEKTGARLDEKVAALRRITDPAGGGVR